MKHVETIGAVDSLGKKHTLLVFQEFTEGKLLSGEPYSIPGMKSIRDQHNHHVNVVDCEKGEFLVVETGVKLKRTSP